MKHVRYIILLLLIGMACSKNEVKSSPVTTVDPTVVRLEFPLKNSECTAGIDQNAEKTLVTFRWAESENDAYELVLENLSSNQVTRTMTSNHAAEIQLDKNTPYEWYIISSISASETKAESERWKFYAAGEGVSNYAPFPADLISPEERASLDGDTRQLALVWQSSDIDDSAITFDVLVGETNPPIEMVASDLAEARFDIAVERGNALYWMIITKDESGNSSYSKVRDFAVGNVSGISTFEISQDGANYTAEVNADARTIRLQLGNFDYKKLSPEISLKEGYSISPRSGEILNFHDSLFYTITDIQGNEIVYDVIVDSGQHEVQSFRFHQGAESYIGEIDTESATIYIEMGNFDYGNLTPEIKISNEATVELSQVTGMNLKSPVTFTVTSEIGTTKEFTVRAPIGMSKLYSYFWNPGFAFLDGGAETEYTIFAGSTQYIYAPNVQDRSQVVIELVNTNGSAFPVAIFRDNYSHQHSYETSMSTNFFNTVIPSHLPASSYTVRISEGSRSKTYPQRLNVLNDNRVIRITEINKTDFIRGDTLIMKGVNLKRDLMVKSNGSNYIFNHYTNDLSVNAEGTEMRLIFSTNVYGNLKSWGNTNEKPLGIQTAIDGYEHKLSSNIIYFNVN